MKSAPGGLGFGGGAIGRAVVDDDDDIHQRSGHAAHRPADLAGLVERRQDDLDRLIAVHSAAQVHANRAGHLLHLGERKLRIDG